MFIHPNREEVTQLSTDHNGVSTIDECMSHWFSPDAWRHEMWLKKHWYKQITTCLAANINPIIVGFMKNKISLVNERNIYF